jgi:hypothetical protein
VLASVGYSATLMLQQRLIALTPDDLQGHALGLHSSCMLAMQGVGAALAGAVAEVTSPAIGITVMAAASVAVTLALTRGLRPTAGLPTAEPQACVPARRLPLPGGTHPADAAVAPHQPPGRRARSRPSRRHRPASTASSPTPRSPCGPPPRHRQVKTKNVISNGPWLFPDRPLHENRGYVGETGSGPPRCPPARGPARCGVIAAP